MHKCRYTLFLLFNLIALTAWADNIKIELTLPVLDVDPYHRPYVAVWLENDNREGVQTLALWREKKDWLKDLRQWWRKLGRDSRENPDFVSGASRRPGTYTITYNSKAANAEPLPVGNYLLHVEAAREEGGREFLQQRIRLGAQVAQHFVLSGQHELGKVIITIAPETNL